MKLLFWNCHGLGNPTIVRELKQVLVANNPDIMFRSETKMNHNGFPHIQNFCRMKGSLAFENHINLRFIGFYDHADSNIRNSSWDMLRWVGGSVREDRVVRGDFNAI
ncbi:putative Transposon TX1 [Gossypium australe]|uniref:Putative Transposon TX1 n=1 Tax=Gossypium australe TaxID=47621 RepID=A0A5B6WRR0_9ROSI|nr:putative Transposon TX1 [Gossypium australe]